MGNRAIITASGYTSDPAIYVHWNGSPETVLAYLDAAKELGFRDPTADSYGLAYLQALIAMHIGDGTGTGIGQLANSDACEHDNGCYVLGPGWTIKSRRNVPAYAKRNHMAQTTVAELTDEQRARYERAKATILRMWRAAQAAAAAPSEEAEA